MRKRKDDPVIPSSNSSYVKPKMVELDKKISHNSVMSICKFFIDRDRPSHLLDQVLHDMEGIGHTSAEGFNQMGQFFTTNFSVVGSSALSVSVYMTILHG